MNQKLSDIIKNYCQKIKTNFDSGNCTEHSYRADLQSLIENIVNGVNVTNEPKRQECGAPDYIIQKKEVPIGYIEAKDVGKNLNKAEKTKQLTRYLESLDNLILTDYLEFRFFVFGEKVLVIKLAEIRKNKIIPLPKNFNSFIEHIKNFCAFKGKTIKSAEKLANTMARKTKMMEEVIYKAVKNHAGTLHGQLFAFQQILIKDLTEKEFADIYAQTIAYGLFAARLNAQNIENFSRKEAAEHIPKTNPFLTGLFNYIAGPSLDFRLIWIVNELADIFRAADINSLLKDFGKSTAQNDPFIHFYETFLGKYDSITKKNRGVFYTPEPVVKFIVQAVDEIITTDFNLNNGLADSSKTKQQLHKVQILDPAAGTGTFLVEIIKQIYNKFENQKGIWSNYVENELIPRVNGFEILMASYTICHLKLDLLLRETGYKPENENNPKRLKVFLTDSLEEAHDISKKNPFAQWLSEEAIEADYLKSEAPIMVVLGNPPYSNFGQMNKGEWIINLLKDYKKDLNETKTNLDNDYVKFIRYGEYFIEKNGEGILAFINDNSFIDSVTFRQMRKHLLQTFDKIYILDLHGNARINEKCPDGGKDENVFDIMQGVSINLFVKTGRKKDNEFGTVFHYDLFGKRKQKYAALISNSLKSIKWKKLKPEKNNFFFVPKDFKNKKEYEKCFSLKNVFKIFGSGMKSERDNITIHFNKETLKYIIDEFRKQNIHDIRNKYQIKDSRDWKINKAKIDLINHNDDSYFQKVNYRPFDLRFTYYTGTSKGFIGTPGQKMNSNMIKNNNLALLTTRLAPPNQLWNRIFVSKNIVDIHAISDQTYVFPLYLFNNNEKKEAGGLKIPTPMLLFDDKEVYTTKQSNFKPEFIAEMSNRLKLSFAIDKKRRVKNLFTSIDIFDYIYAVLYSPAYRDKYDEFLKIDFPRVPYPENQKSFWHFVKIGSELRKLHLFESPKLKKRVTTYPNEGNNIVEIYTFEPIKKNIGKVWINEKQFFDNVPLAAWESHIGSYQPAQKWLKDRKGRKLDFDDISHYQEIIVTLTETEKLMKKLLLI